MRTATALLLAFLVGTSSTAAQDGPQFRAQLNAPILFSGPPENTASCTLPWGEVLEHGAEVVAYHDDTPHFGVSCLQETRSCSDGVLSGDYGYASCQLATSMTLEEVFTPEFIHLVSGFGVSSSTAVDPNSTTKRSDYNSAAILLPQGELVGYDWINGQSKSARLYVHATLGSFSRTECMGFMTGLDGKIQSGSSVRTIYGSSKGSGSSWIVNVTSNSLSTVDANKLCDWLFSSAALSSPWRTISITY